MLLSLDLLPEILGYSALFGLIYWLLYRRYIYAIVDPLFIFVFTTTFGSVLAIEILTEPRYVWHFFICQICVWAGFALVQERTGNPAVRPAPVSLIQFTDVRLMQYTTYVLFGIYLLSNLIILQTKGFALLSDAPSNAKVTNFQQGFGFFRKINWAVGGVASAGLTFLYLSKSRRRDLLLLLAMMLLTSLEGSKGALVRYVISFGLFLYHPVFRQQTNLLRRIKRFAPAGFVGLFAVVFAVLIKENESNEAILLAFVRRLLYGADALLYFYQPVNVAYFARYSWADFPGYVLNPILGFLRLAPYREAFGNVMVENTFPAGFTVDVIVGPNSPFYTEGQVFFGYYGAFIFSFVLGILASWARSAYFSLQRSPAFLLIFASTLYQFSAALLGDITVFTAQVSDTLILVLPVYALVCLVTQNRITFRPIHFATKSTA